MLPRLALELLCGPLKPWTLLLHPLDWLEPPSAPLGLASLYSISFILQVFIEVLQCARSSVSLR